MSIIFFRFFLLFSVVANSVGAQDSAPSGLLADSHQLSTLAFATKILYEIMLVRIFCNFSFFFTQFFWLMGWVGELFCGFLRFQLLFSGFFSAFGFGLGCFKSFMDYSSTRACLLCYQPMAIVHYANLVLLNKYTFLTEVGTRAPGTDGAPVLSCRHIAKQFRYC